MMEMEEFPVAVSTNKSNGTLNVQTPEKNANVTHTNLNYRNDWDYDLEDFIYDSWDAEVYASVEMRYVLVSNLFMRRVENDGMWSMFRPDDVSDLNDLSGEEFENIYTSLENDNNILRKSIPAKDLFKRLLDISIDHGVPFMVFKDKILTCS